MTTGRKRGFTLVEVLLVTAVFASVGLAVFSCLSNGIRLWTRSQSLLAEKDAAVFLDRIGLELRNSFLYSRIPFRGEELSLAFPTVVMTAADRRSSRAHEEFIDQIGSIRYSFDPAGGAILREQANYSQAIRGEFAPARIEVSGVEGLRFRYYYPGSRDPRVSANMDDKIPSGIEVEITLSGNGGERTYRRYVPIPAGA